MRSWAEVDKANLRGRGGAGFPAGRKWKHTKSAPGSIKLVIANGDERRSRRFLDRSIMEGDPHSLLGRKNGPLRLRDWSLSTALFM